jgi:hypothetical protein
MDGADVRKAAGIAATSALILMTVGCGNASSRAIPSAAPVYDAKFGVHKTPLTLPRACKPVVVVHRLAVLVRAFNSGNAPEFARSFASAGSFKPYSETLRDERPYLSGPEVASFVTSRHAKGDGWTLLFVFPPLGRAGLPRVAVYGVGVRVTQRGKTISVGGSKAVIDCKSGLIQNWVGPKAGPPD